MTSLSNFIDFSPTSLLVAVIAIAFNPIFWNVAARAGKLIQQSHIDPHFWGPYNGCYFLAVVIFSLGILRDHIYQLALEDQPFYAPVYQPILGGILFTVGSVLVLSSMWALGVTGTYLGDYFGILMDAPVTGFPFNVTSSPMYWGSTLNFLGVALYKGKVAGILLTAEVFVVYWFALKWEDPFTAEIYAKRERERSKKQGGKAQ
ncbi:phospholipid methyltransferase-domain-containing protein [Penicillium chermesinum]|nr:phospholipid methyltransferase-domain-containing protein [Penicillium chermesinum]